MYVYVLMVFLIKTVLQQLVSLTTLNCTFFPFNFKSFFFALAHFGLSFFSLQKYDFDHNSTIKINSINNKIHFLFMYVKVPIPSWESNNIDIERKNCGKY